MTSEPLHPHKWGPYGPRDDNDANAECDVCGMLVELDVDGNPLDAINFECSGRLGDY